MVKKEFTLQSNYDELPLSCIICEPQNSPKGIVQLVHGMCEHKERYLEFMEFLCENGYVAACHDHRGHGDSVKSEADFGWFGDYDGKAVVDDAVQFSRYLKEEYAGLPLILFGHSMGSLVVRCYVREHDEEIDKLIVCGSPSKNPLSGVAIFLEKCIRLFKGARHRSKMLAFLATGKGDKQFPGEGKCAWLSKNKESVAAYLASPKCSYRFTCNGFENLFKLLKRTYTKKGYEVKNPNLPIHFVAGGDDPVIVNEKQWFNAVEFMKSLGYEQVTGKLYDGLRHEILQELERKEVYQDLLAFIER